MSRINTDGMTVRCLGGALLVIRGNDSLTIERGANGQPKITWVEGEWTADEQESALTLWEGSEAEAR